MSESEEEYYTFEDDQGETFQCRVLDRLTMNGVNYAVLCETEDEDSVLIFRVTDNGDGTEDLDYVEDDDENEEVFDFFRIAYEDYEFGDAE